MVGTPAWKNHGTNHSPKKKKQNRVRSGISATPLASAKEPSAVERLPCPVCCQWWGWWTYHRPNSAAVLAWTVEMRSDHSRSYEYTCDENDARITPKGSISGVGGSGALVEPLLWHPYLVTWWLISQGWTGMILPVETCALTKEAGAGTDWWKDIEEKWSDDLTNYPLRSQWTIENHWKVSGLKSFGHFVLHLSTTPPGKPVADHSPIAFGVYRLESHQSGFVTFVVDAGHKVTQRSQCVQGLVHCLQVGWRKHTLWLRGPPGFPVGASLNQLDRIQQPIVSEPGNHENWNPKVHLLRGSHGTRLSFLGLGGWVTHPTSKSSGIIIAFLGLGIMQPATDISIIIIPVLRSVNMHYKC